MFDNVGKKIKGVAKVFCWIGIIASILYPFITIINLYTGSYVSKEMKILIIIRSILILILGPLASWLASLTLYGFGELVDKADSIDSKLPEKGN